MYKNIDPTFERNSHEPSKEEQLLSALAQLKTCAQMISYRGSTPDLDLIKTIRGILLQIHPDKHNGDDRFLRLTKIAVGLFELSRISDPHSDEHYAKYYKQTSEAERALTVLEDEFSPKPAPAPYKPYVDPAPFVRSERWKQAYASPSEPEEEPEEEQEWKPPYEVVDFSMDTHLIGRKITLVEIDLEKEILERLLNEGALFNDYGGKDVLAAFKIEGFSGVVVCVRTSSDGYRDSGCTWLLIQDCKGVTKKDLGTIRSFQKFDTQHEYNSDGYDRGTHIQTSSGAFRVGEEASDGYYPHVYCNVS